MLITLQVLLPHIGHTIELVPLGPKAAPTGIAIVCTTCSKDGKQFIVASQDPPPYGIMRGTPAPKSGVKGGKSQLKGFPKKSENP